MTSIEEIMIKQLEERVAKLENWKDRIIKTYINRNVPIGPSPTRNKEIDSINREKSKELLQKAIDSMKKVEDVPPVDRTNIQLTDGSPVTPEHKELKDNGQQRGYIVLTEEERKKGFIRPVRTSYTHVGLEPPKNPLRDLTGEEHKDYDHYGYVKYEEYLEDKNSSVVGKYWTQKEIDKINNGCETVTTMGLSLAETYARDPSFYGATFCCGCGTHLPVSEFIWDGTNERLGS